ncbi:preprotein translocase subunit SecG [Lysobacter daejeonensis GH1-9]|uniref:Protein-export membrane protein SecG n=1 Tax=Lysobacter daejeonensis GH1-9 TaxID=1385517 RepID=A0A0A0EZ92_9GAMM|nr:preprotein translocase subunit SecG [Lysobacter daejeonensis]KGM55635.1 preprotein translocase subunit SecG [Lysobacter daejeonensis GH1-9]
MLVFLNVIYVLVAVAMIALILMQRGAGAQAGSGFGGGASATVFGARGASNFLSKSTKWLAIVFFGISLFMAWQATKNATGGSVDTQDLGLMSQTPVAPAEAPAQGGAVPVAPAAQSVPAAPTSAAPAAVPAAPTPEAVPAEQAPATPPKG